MISYDTMSYHIIYCNIIWYKLKHMIYIVHIIIVYNIVFNDMTLYHSYHVTWFNIISDDIISYDILFNMILYSDIMFNTIQNYIHVIYRSIIHECENHS